MTSGDGVRPERDLSRGAGPGTCPTASRTNRGHRRDVTRPLEQLRLAYRFCPYRPITRWSLP